MTFKSRNQHPEWQQPTLVEAFLNGLVQIWEAQATKQNDHKDNLDNPKKKVKVVEADAKKLITPKWIADRRLEIAKLAEAYESPVENLPNGMKGANLGKVNGFDVIAVDGDEVMITYDMDFVVAGNHRKWKWISKNQFWVDKDYEIMDIDHDILHECVEEHIMAKLGWEYDDAHNFANKVEKQYIKDIRKEHEKDKNRISKKAKKEKVS